MNYIPIFSPVNGIIDTINQESVRIHIDIEYDGTINAPIFGTITEINNESSDNFQIYISNEYLENPIIVNFKKATQYVHNVHLSKNQNINYNDIIGYAQSNSLCEININKNKNKNVKVVDIGMHVLAGTTIIEYIKISQQIAINTEPKQLIVLTIPHFVCINDTEKKHNCDYSAERLAESLKQVLIDKDVYFYNGNINRTFIDLNRIQSNKTDFRKVIRNRIKMKIKEIIATISSSKEENIIYILDCHSFPSPSFSNIRFSDPQISILLANCEQLIYVDELTEIFRDYGIHATKHIGSGNAIIEEFYNFNKKYKLEKYNIKIIPILIEANESLTNDQMMVACHAIVKWISTVNKYIIEKVFN